MSGSVKSKSESEALNFVFPSGMRARIVRLQLAFGISTLKDAVATAIRIAEWVAQQKAEGREILVRERDGSQRIVEFI